MTRLNANTFVRAAKNWDLQSFTDAELQELRDVAETLRLFFQARSEVIMMRYFIQKQHEFESYLYARGLKYGSCYVEDVLLGDSDEYG